MSDDPHGDHLVALPIGTMLSEYRIQSVLGQGGFGITYLALDTLLNETVAVKEYFPNETAVRTRDFSARAKSGRDRDVFEGGLQAFLNEARIIARFRHPNIMQVRRFFEAHGTGYIVLDFVRGRSLEDVIAAAPLPEPLILSIFSGVMQGLATVHERAVLHRDLKPRNVILRETGVPILIDFGAARDFGARNSLTVTKIASPGYSSPEQYGIGTTQQGPWSDFYSLGAILYRAVTGQVPPDALKRLRDDPLVPASKIAAGSYSAPLLRLIDRMMQMDEVKRPASAADILKALPGLETARPVPVGGAEGPLSPESRHDWTASRSSRSTARKKRGGLWPILAGLAVLLLGAAGGGAYMMLQPARHAPPPSEVLHEAESAQGAQQAAVQVPKSEPSQSPARVAVTPQPTPVPIPEPTPAPVSTAPVEAPPVAAPVETAKVSKPLAPGMTFQDCAHCPTMVVIPPGAFSMGNAGGAPAEKPVHRVTIQAPFALGRTEVTFDEWDACVTDGGCSYKPGDRGWGRDTRPAIDLSWADAQAYLAWLSKTTGKHYRLPSEAEWEYADRAGTTSIFWWGDAAGTGHAVCSDCGTPGGHMTSPVGGLAANKFGLYDTAGNVAEWVQDCWMSNYDGAPTDGSAVDSGQCGQRVLRGGSFASDSRYLRSAARFKYDNDVRYYSNGFRVARDIDAP